MVHTPTGEANPTPSDHETRGIVNEPLILMIRTINIPNFAAKVKVLYAVNLINIRDISRNPEKSGQSGKGNKAENLSYSIHFKAFKSVAERHRPVSRKVKSNGFR